MLAGRAPGAARPARPSTLTVIAFLQGVASRLRGIRLNATASSLAFTTLLALVPLATVAFAVVSQFPLFERGLATLEDWLVRVLMPGTGTGVVRDAIKGFAEQAARLAPLTVAFLAVTAAMLVATIDTEINAIFAVRRQRPLWRRAIVYVLGVTLGPALVGASLSATTWLFAQSLEVVPVGPSFTSRVGRLLPWFLAAAALTLVYQIVPYCRVRWRHAILGGALAAGGLEVAKAWFAWYVSNVPTYRQIYGALAVLPLFMLWLYVGWLIVLVGAAIVSALTPGSRRVSDR
jgi:membrane protein